ncbi:FadR/GntR family transcriptional regulator [Rhodococcus sp. NPDC003318]|uniref:FadR/GntR family transcriptional regulator n=1 Tax=Rhodococcus sp. NPDC003318 TaxID=3364503 RepID=UPI0036ACE8F7
MRLLDGDPTAVAPEKLAVQVARRIEHEIIERHWPIGEVLGSETALREQFGVSRSILREAVRLLELHRVAHMRQGPGGGLVVSSPDPRSAIRALVIYLEYIGVSVEQLVRARSIVEPTAVSTVSDSLTERGIRELRSVASKPHRGHLDTFHLEMGRLTGNPALELFVEILTRLTATYTHRALQLSPDADRAHLEEPQRRHQAITDAVVAGDVSRAQNELSEDLGEIAAWLSRFVDPVPGDRTATRPTDPDPDERPSGKLAESLAGRIHDDIVAESRNVGEVLGTEADFVTRYGVSRSIFREAVRILEHYSVARMRRGQGGGLVVLEPDPTSSIRMVVLYLGFRGVTAEHLRAVRDVIELGCLTVVMRAGTVDRADLTTDRPGGGSATLCRCSVGLRDRIEMLTGDGVLMLLRSILAVLWDEFGSEPSHVESCRPEAGEPDVQKELDAIVDAMVAGDEVLARHRMRRHLRAHVGL